MALFSLSLFAFVLSMMSFDLPNLPARFSDKLPRRGIADLLFFAAAFLGLAWLGRIAPTILHLLNIKQPAEMTGSSLIKSG